MTAPCTACRYHKSNNGKYVRGLGNLEADLLIVGESPSLEDSRSGQPFSGRTPGANGDADLLDTLLAEIGLTRAQVFTTHLLECRLPVDAKGVPEKLDDACVLSCHPKLDWELSYVKPKVILALGAGTAKRLTGSKTLAAVQGRVIDSADCLGLTYAASGETKKSTKKGVKTEEIVNKAEAFKVIPTFSLSMVRRDPTAIDILRRAFQKAKDVLDGKKSEELVYDYTYAHTEEDCFKVLTAVLGRCGVEKRLFFDIETTGLNWYPVLIHDHVSTMISCAFGFKEREVFGVMFRARHRSFRNMLLFQQIMEHPIAKSGHNGMFDNVFIRGEFGYRVRNFDRDTMLAAFQCDQGSRVGLGVLSPVYRPDLGYYWEAIEKKLDALYGYMNAPDDELLQYNCRDVDATITLYHAAVAKMEERGMMECFTKITMPLANALEETEYYGVKLDVEATKALGRVKLKELDACLAKIFELTGRHPEDMTSAQLLERGITPEAYRPFNPASGKQIGELLYGELKQTPLSFTDSGAPSTDSDALSAYADKFPWVAALLDYKRVSKELSTYIGWVRYEDGTEGITKKKGSSALLAVVDRNGRVHTSYHVAGTASGRLSSSAPNLQNIPKSPEFRRLFVPEDGFSFVDADYSGLELRVAACMSGDEELLEVFRSGVDPHAATAAKMFGMTLEDFQGVDVQRGDTTEVFPSFAEAQKKYPDLKKSEARDRKDRKERKAAKIVNFGILYGQGPGALAEAIGVSKAEAKQYLAEWHRVYAGVSKWMKTTIAEVRRTGEVRYSLGRSRRLPEIWSSDIGLSSGAERQAVNTPVQGSGSDCTSLANIDVNARLDREFGLDNARVVMTVHDQLVTECRDTVVKDVARVIREEMERDKPVIPNLIPLEVDLHIKKSLGDVGESG